MIGSYQKDKEIRHGASLPDRRRLNSGGARGRHCLLSDLGRRAASIDPVKVEASAVKPGNDGNTTVTVKLTIDKAWHIYANPVGHDDLAAAQTTVVVKSAGQPIAAKVKYPAGTAHTDKTIGQYKIYEGNVTIQADVPKTDGPLEVTVKYQACDSKQCLLPKTVKIKLPSRRCQGERQDLTYRSGSRQNSAWAQCWRNSGEFRYGKLSSAARLNVNKTNRRSAS